MNKDRDAINTGIFSEYLQNAQCSESNTPLLVFMDELHIKNGKEEYVPLKNHTKFWQECGEDSLKVSGGNAQNGSGQRNGRVDPVLKLYKGGPVMLTTNDDVKGGKANGTRATVLQIVIKPSTSLAPVGVGGERCNAVLASGIASVVLRRESSSEIITMEPRRFYFSASIPKPESLQTRRDRTDRAYMKGMQLPFISNSATTGHKLQGATLAAIFVSCWSYKTNWPYVVLSRVT